MIYHKNPTSKNIILIPFYEVKGPDDKQTCLVWKTTIEMGVVAISAFKKIMTTKKFFLLFFLSFY